MACIIKKPIIEFTLNRLANKIKFSKLKALDVCVVRECATPGPVVDIGHITLSTYSTNIDHCWYLHFTGYSHFTLTNLTFHYSNFIKHPNGYHVAT